MHAYHGSTGDDVGTNQIAPGEPHLRNREFWCWFETEAKPKLGMRADTFEAIFRHLDKLGRPVAIIETGCVRGFGDKRPGENWAGDGCSTILFDRYVTANGGVVRSVDIDSEATKRCRELVGHRTHINTCDSIKWLAQESKFMLSPIDLLYLDSFDLDTTRPLASQVHHANELAAAMPMIGPDTLVVVDDSPVSINDWGMVEVHGKGALVARHAVEVGADMRFCMYQIGWTGMRQPETPAIEVRTDSDLKGLVERARVCAEKNNSVSAANLYRLVLELTNPPKTGVECIARGEACLFYARAALSRGKIGAAEDWYREAFQNDPKAYWYRLEMATKVIRPRGNLLAARREATIATKIAPDDPNTWHILGGIEHDLDDEAAVRACYDREMALAPDDPDSLYDMISILIDVPDYQAAQQLIDRAMEIDKTGEPYHCRGFIAYRESRHEEAIDLFTKALDLGVTQPATVHWNRSLAYHALGRYREGWRDHDWRALEKTQIALSMPMLRFAVPVWKREPPPARIHIHAEAGAGDNLCCARYLKMLVDDGYDVRYEAYPDMVPLIQRSFPAVKVIPQAIDYPGAIGIEQFDYHQPIGGLPNVYETDIDTVPWHGPYLLPDPTLVEKYRAMLSAGQRKIGLCWSAGIRPGLWLAKYGKGKSMHFDALEPLFKPGCSDDELLRLPHFVSLQVGPERAENGSSYVEDILPEYPSWDDTAALVANLDLVITVDTAVMHLAGAMGKPTWVMAQKDGASWHLMCERPGASWNTASPWYPSIRVFRQHQFNRPGHWRDVVGDVAGALDQLLAGGGRADAA